MKRKIACFLATTTIIASMACNAFAREADAGLLTARPDITPAAKSPAQPAARPTATPRPERGTQPTPGRTGAADSDTGTATRTGGGATNSGGIGSAADNYTLNGTRINADNINEMLSDMGLSADQGVRAQNGTYIVRDGGELWLISGNFRAKIEVLIYADSADRSAAVDTLDNALEDKNVIPFVTR